MFCKGRPMARIMIIGNAGGGKSTLARRIAAQRGIPHVEVDRLLWQDGWVLTPARMYDQQHDQIISQAEWLIDGLGRQDSIAPRIARATEIILIDMPVWMHFWLAAERQIEWSSGTLRHAPGGISDMPPTRELFRTIWDVEQNWMPKIRRLCAEAKQQGKAVIGIDSVDALDAFARSL
jgi:adenylate kinase family enzyme